ncbi:integrase [Gossypium australe]|uniref:Integrase n=1 Tax=Gossypium australe TaxID=47621 RepID=A0A5B6X2C0_9ROSI|nr:integrase [Gossypium australe]
MAKCLVCQQVKSEHQVSSGTDFSLKRLTELYVFEIVRLHRVPISIIFDRDLRFTSRLWIKLHETLGAKLNFNTTFHP